MMFQFQQDCQKFYFCVGSKPRGLILLQNVRFSNGEMYCSKAADTGTASTAQSRANDVRPESGGKAS